MSYKLGLLAAMLLSATGQVSGAVITQRSYTESRDRFDWIVEWNAVLPGPMDQQVFDPTRRPGGSRFWDPRISFNSLDGDGRLNDLFVFGQHLKGPHINDQDPGSSSFVVIRDVNMLPSTFDPSTKDVIEVTLKADLERHKFAPPPNHQDLYEFSYTRGRAGGPAFFFYNGRHIGMGARIPEPGTLHMLGIALVLLLSWRRLAGLKSRAG